MAADGRIVIDVILESGEVARGVADINGQLGGLNNGGQRAALGIGKIVTALGLVALASKGINMVKEALDGAISRYDTLGGFPKILAQMGFDSEQSAKAISRLSDGISGLPTTLDSVAATAQKIAIMTGDLDGAVDATLALNNAFLASGSNGADASRGLIQYTQMLSKGKVDMMSWRTLQETMGVALNDVAKAFGFAGKSAQNDLYEALKKGTITFDQFNAKLIELNDGTNGFAVRALIASEGIRTAFSNMKTSIVRGVTAIIGAIDGVLANTSLKSIENILMLIGKAFSTTLTSIADGIPVVVEKLKEFYNVLEPWMPLITNIAIVVGAFLATMGTLNSAIVLVRGAIVALNVVLLANPFVLIVSAIGALIAIFVILYQSNEDFRNKVNEVWASIEGTFTTVLESIKTSITEIITGVIDFVKTQLDNLKTYWAENGEQIKANVVTAFEVIKETITTVVGAILDFVKPQLDKIKTFWDENGSQILEAVKNAFNGIKAVIDFVMPAIKFVIEMVWTAIKQVITGALDIIMGLVKVFSGLFTGDFSKMWEGVKQIFFGAIDLVIGWLTLTFVGGIRTLLANLLKGSVTTVTGMWTSIVNVFKSFGTNTSNLVKNMATGIVNFFKNILTNATSIFNTLRTFGANVWSALSQAILNVAKGIYTGVKTNFTNMLSSIKNIFGTVNSTITTIWNGVMNFFKGINLKQIGIDIIQGLINGIGSMASAVWDKAKSIASGIGDSIKKVLQIASPSKLTTQFGKWVGEGLANGIDATKKDNEKAITGVAKVLSAAARKNVDEVTKIATDAEKKRTEIQNDYAKKREELSRKTTQSSQSALKTHKNKKGVIVTTGEKKVYNIRANASAALTKLNEDEQKKLASINTKAWADMQKKEAELSKARLESVKTYVADKKSLDELSLVAESEVWRKSIALFEVGTKERVEAQKAYQASLKVINDNILKVNDEYSQKMQKINENLRNEEQKLTDEYTKSVEERTKALTNFVSIFDAYEYKFEQTGDDLTNNLRSQVSALEGWSHAIEILSEKAIDKGLLEELRAIGPKALPQLMALNQMTDKQLTEYSALYKKKAELARQTAEKELIGMKSDTEKRIIELRVAANKELGTLEKEWTQKIASVTKATDDELKSLKDIGKNAGQGLLNGLASMESSLVNKARSIAESVKKAMAGALDIHSPSRWMRDMIGKNMMLGWIDGIDRQKSATINKAKQATGWMKPEVPKVGGFVNKLRGVTAPIGNVMPFSAAQNGGGSSSSSTDNRKTFSPIINNNFTPAESTPSQSVRKQQQLLQRLALEF